MNFKTLFSIIIWVFAILMSIFSIFRIIPNIEIATGFITMSFGILAIIWTSIARANLSKGSSLRNYTTSFLFCLIFILLFSIWDTFDKIFEWNGLTMMPKYIFITIAYLIFSYASYSIWKIGKEFGFKDEAKKIDKVIKEKQLKKSRA